MTGAQRATYAARLRELEREIIERGPVKIRPNRTSVLEPADLEDEQPLNEMLQAVASGRNRSRAAELARVRHALEKLRDEPELFGLCEECEEPIAKARLEAMPYAEFCVACQQKNDSPRGGPRRKLTDYR